MTKLLTILIALTLNACGTSNDTTPTIPVAKTYVKCYRDFITPCGYTVTTCADGKSYTCLSQDDANKYMNQ